MKPPKPPGHTRYHQLLDIIDLVRPETIVEVGTHRGTRAEWMVDRAFRWRPHVRYVGYDIFERGGVAFQLAAGNGKGMVREREARGMMKKLAARHGAGFGHELIVGDTRETLAGRHVAADLAFIDGDHRVEAIADDHAALAGCRCVVFDDYFLPGRAGQIPDLTVWGANALLNATPGALLMPHVDTTSNGKRVVLGVIARPDVAALLAPLGARPAIRGEAA